MRPVVGGQRFALPQQICRIGMNQGNVGLQHVGAIVGDDCAHHPLLGPDRARHRAFRADLHPEFCHWQHEVRGQVRLERIVELAQERGPLNQHLRRDHLFDQRKDDLLLTGVARAILVPGSHIAERHVAVEVIGSCLHIERLESRVGCVRKRRVVDRRGHVDVLATKEIDQPLEPVEVQREPVVHLHAELAGHAPPQRIRAFSLPE